jgi:hypothetical protein
MYDVIVLILTACVMLRVSPLCLRRCASARVRRRSSSRRSCQSRARCECVIACVYDCGDLCICAISLDRVVESGQSDVAARRVQSGEVSGVCCSVCARVITPYPTFPHAPPASIEKLLRGGSTDSNRAPRVASDLDDGKQRVEGWSGNKCVRCV